MERPWLLLRRVVDVGMVADDDDLHADAEGGEVVDPPEVDADEHAAVAEAEADAQAQHAGVEEAEEHFAAVDAAAEAQAQHAAVAEAEEHAIGGDAAAEAQAHAQHAAVDEAEDGAQGQGDEHDAVDEAHDEEDAQALDGEHDAILDEAQDEEDALAQEGEHAGVEEDEELDMAAEDLAAVEAFAAAQLVLEESVVNVNTDGQQAEEAHAAHGADEPDFTVLVARPPFVSILMAGLGSHPDPARPDMYPYIIAAGRFCLLVHFAVAPSHGTNFAQGPNPSHLVVVRHFLRDEDGEINACAVNVPDRPVNDLVNMPALRNIESLGLVCNQETGHYQIAELIVTTGAPEAVVVYIGTDIGVWQANYRVNPLLAVDPDREWVPHGTLAINSTVLWFDLSWGIISCDLAQPPELQVLDYHRVPPGRVLRAGAVVPDIHCRRCIAVSENMVRYVEIILDDPDRASTVNMWFRNVEDNPWRWETNYSVRFEHIWDHQSYAQTELPRNVPVIVGVSPVDSRVVYFSLDQRLFGINVPEHTVVECQLFEPLRRPGPPDEPVTSRYFVTWNLDDNLEPNVGHQPDNLADHADDYSDEGDEGEIDYSDGDNVIQPE